MNKLSQEEMSFFEKLTEDREDSNKTLTKPSMKGVKRSVVEKYSDQAHFIYELLQNADDAKATQARFILKDHGLYFLHNGFIHFSISDPQREEDDKNIGNLGHINSITSIANSTKEKASIGKFGVGFKAVFQYTNTPHIYDPRFRFKIENLIVPKLLDEDLIDNIERKETDTVFYFPFNRTDLSKEEAYIDIFEKLEALVYPTLFLLSLNEVSWQTNNLHGKYSKKVIKEESGTNTKIQLLDIIKETVSGQNTKRIWLFSRQLTEINHSYSIGYFLDNDTGRLKPSSFNYAFCFFPTKKETGLKFIIHAPFLLTDNRAEIRAGDKWNLNLISKLSNFAADSLMSLKEKGLLDDNIFDIIPYIESAFSREGDKDNISFMPFYAAIKEKFKNGKLLPSRNGEFVNKNHAYWAESTELANLFSNEQLVELVNDADAKLVFTSIVRTKDEKKRDYIDGGDERIGRQPNLIVENLTTEKFFKRITQNFIQKQYNSNPDWLHKLYKYLQGTTSYKVHVKDKPIFINTQGQAVSAFNKDNQLILFLPTDSESEYTTIHKDLLNNEISRRFFEEFGIKIPSLKEEIYSNILPLYNTDDDNDNYDLHFRKIFKYYKECPSFEIHEYLELIKNKKIIRYKLLGDGKIYKGIANTIYLPSDKLKQYFETKPDTHFLDIEFYIKLLGKPEIKTCGEFLFKLGIRKSPKIFNIEIEYHELSEKVQKSLSLKGRTLHYYDKELDGCKELINQINKEKSIVLWRQLISCIVEDHQFLDIIQGERNYSYYGSSHPERFESTEYKRLTQFRWIYKNNGVFVAPNEVYIDDLLDDYDTTSNEAKLLISFLGIKDNSEKQRAAEALGLNLNVVELIKNNPESFEKWMENIKSTTNDNPRFPQRKVTDSEQRTNAMVKKYKDSEKKQYKVVERVERVSSPPVGEKKSYLENNYTNDEGIMVCQICEKEMPFKKLDGKYYFEIREICKNTKNVKSKLNNETEESYIALCPICSAKYNVFVHTKPEEMSKICTLIEDTPPTESESTKIPVTLDKEQTITFVAPHLKDLKSILESES